VNRTVPALILLASILLSCIAVCPLVNSAGADKIFIRSDGSVEPSTAPLQRDEQNYFFTANINSQIVIEANNVTLDGAGYLLQGAGAKEAVNITCSNSTVQNIRIINWESGVLGVYGNNTVKNCVITQCQIAIKIYAQYYVVVGNEIVNNHEGIHIGEGGLNFIAQNNITDSGIALSLTDSGNIITQNNIANNKLVIHISRIGYDQMIYRNNFINNTSNIEDSTFSSFGPKANVLPWDDGSNGNYWSDYNGTDTNRHGVGDNPQIMVGIYGYTLSDYHYVDRYPLISPVNINSPIPQIPTYLTVGGSQLVPNQNSQTKVTSFFRNVLQLDLDKYRINVNSDKMGVPIAQLTTEYLAYSFFYTGSIFDATEGSSFDATVTICNNTITYCVFENMYGKILTTFQYTDNFEFVSKVMSNYQNWLNDLEVNKMTSLLNQVGSNKNATVTSGDMQLKVEYGKVPVYTSETANQTLFSWNYNFNGADYTGVTFEFLKNLNEATLSSTTFTDNRAIYQVGDTSAKISEQQAVNIAENYLKEYGYKEYIGNETIGTIKNPTIKNNVQASLSTALRNPTTLYPYWNVIIPIAPSNQTYLGDTGITVKVWADSGRVMDTQRQIASTPTNYIVPNLIFLQLDCYIAIFAVGVVLFVVGIFEFHGNRKKQKIKNHAQF
jgi:hypothetical protein